MRVFTKEILAKRKESTPSKHCIFKDSHKRFMRSRPMTGKPKYFLFPHQELYLTYNTLTFARHFHSSLASSRVKTGLEGKVSFFENLLLFYRNKMQVIISNFRPMPVV